MKITTVFEGTYISVKKTSYVDKDNKPVYANYIAMECSDDVGNVQCTDVVRDELQTEQKYSCMKFQGVFDTYQRVLVVTGYCLKSNEGTTTK